MCNTDDRITELAYLLTGYVFEHNDDILKNNEGNHIDIFIWNNKSDNIRWAIQIENKFNQGNSENTTILVHK
jgi:hypothetical protein